MLSAASAWSSCSSVKPIRSTSLTPGPAVVVRGNPGCSGVDAEVRGAVDAPAHAGSTSSVSKAAVGNEAGAGAGEGGSLLTALFRAAASTCLSRSQAVSDSHRRVKAFPQSQRCSRLLMLACRKLLAGGAGPSTGRGLFVVAELARGGRAGGGSAEGAGAEAGSRPNATSTPRRNCAECVAKVAGARDEGLDVLHSAGWAGFAAAARYALPAGDA